MRKSFLGLALLLVSGDAWGQQPFVRFVDPTEHAFSLDVPAGWLVQGGVRRRSPIQPHDVVTVTSPGGLAQIVLGNLDAYSYSVTTPMGMQLGFREGVPYSPGVDNLMMLNYRSGWQFAEMYGVRFLSQACQNVRVVNGRERNDAGYAPMVGAGGLTFSGSGGEAFFTCVKDGHNFDAYVFAMTELTHQPNVPGGIWNAEHTYMFITPAGNGGAAGMVLMHMIKSFQIDGPWLATQLKISGDAANHAIAQANAQLGANSNTIGGTFADGSPQAQTQDEWHRLISGFDTYQTAAGDQKTVPYATAQHWWSNGQGKVVGTQGSGGPKGFEEMQRTPLGR
jgi:hypothetical protein